MIFAFFFLVPPFYMLVTSLKSSAEIGAPINPGSCFTRRFRTTSSCWGSSQDPIFFKNSALVSVIVVAVTMLISIPAAFALSRMKFWGSTALATGVFLTYLIPDSLLFIPMFKIFAFLHDVTGIQFLDRWWVLTIIYRISPCRSAPGS